MAFTNTYDVTTPANASVPSGGAAAIRLLKDALQERLNPDHYFAKSGDTVDDDTQVGFHRKATLLVQAVAPALKADAGIVYSKDVAAKAELFYRDEDGDEIQITSGGLLNSTGFISGDLLLTANTGAKSGWTDVSTTYANQFLRVSATALATGGADAHTHTGPSHTHTVSITTGTGSTVQPDVYGGGGAQCSLNTHTHSVSGNTGADGTGVTGSGANVPIYRTVRMYSKD